MNTVMNYLSITSGSDTVEVYNDESWSSSSQTVQLLEGQSQTISQDEQQSSKLIKTATILDRTFLKLILLTLKM